MECVNIGLVAHVDAGKTTLTEQLLYLAGVTQKPGSVDSGTTKSDFLGVERDRGISVRSALMSFEYNGRRINLIDTPGHADFSAEVERSMEVLDAAVLIVSAVEGVQPQTELLCEALIASGTRVIFFINKIDRAGSNVAGVLAEIQSRYAPGALLLSKIEGEGSRGCVSVPVELSDDDIASRVAEVLEKDDEALFEKYLEFGALSAGEVSAAIKKYPDRLMPVVAGAAMHGVGTRQLLEVLSEYAEPRRNDPENRLSGIVYKITHDKRMGRLAHIRMFGGELKNRDAVTLNPNTDEQREGKITQIKSCFGAKLADVGEARRGDVVAVSGLSDARVYDIIGELSERTGCRLSEPMLRVRVIPPSPDKLDETLSAFEELAAEDPKLGLQYYRTEREITVGIIGTIQLEILAALARERYGLEVTFGPPAVIYKETPAGKGHGFDAYTMPKPCWAIVELELEPGPRGSGLVYSSEIKDNVIPYRYQSHIALSVPRALKQGLLNWEVTDLSVRLIGGGYHSIHTHPLDFFLCTPIAVMKALADSGTTLLEPMQMMRIVAGEEHAGRIIGDMIDMHAEYDSPVIKDGKLMMEARAPVSRSMDYAMTLAAATSGRGAVSARFGGYRECPEGTGEAAKRRGVNPLDRDRWILANRGAMGTGDIMM